MYIWIHDKFRSTSFKQCLWQRKIVLIWKKKKFQIMCVIVVQWWRSCSHVPINGVRLPATLFSVSLPYHFFSSVWSLFFNAIFPFGLFSFILTADPAGHALGSIYVLSLSAEFYFGKGFFKSSRSACWPSLRPEKKNISCQDMSLLWNSWIFFNVSWQSWQTRHSTPQTVLI